MMIDLDEWLEKKEHEEKMDREFCKKFSSEEADAMKDILDRVLECGHEFKAIGNSRVCTLSAHSAEMINSIALVQDGFDELLWRLIMLMRTNAFFAKDEEEGI